MTIVLRHHSGLELHRIEWLGSITAAELSDVIDFQEANPQWLACDAMNVVLPGAHFDTMPLSNLDAVFSRYSALFVARRLTVLRRAAWVCQSPAAQAHVSHWINARNLRQGMLSEIRQFNTFPEACAWLVLPPEHASMLESGESFVELARFESPAAAAVR